MGIIARQIRSVLPERWHPPARYAYERAMGMLERELPLAVASLQPGDTAIDVGANAGIYTYAFSRTAARVEAFEPQAAWSAVLRAFAASQPLIRIHQVALGATSGTAMLTVPVIDDIERPGDGRVTAGEADGANEPVMVETLDSFGFDRVALIKVDVEGGEVDVLAGAVETLHRNRPLLLIEIEQRHHEERIDRVFARLAALEYEGFFLDAERRIRPVSEFDLAQHQEIPLSNKAAGPYINNFLFQRRVGGREWPGPR